MERPEVEKRVQLALRIQPPDKATIRRAAAIQQTDITSFVLRAALREAAAVIARSERVTLSKRDTALVIELLAHPPAPNRKLLAAARGLPADW